MKHIFLFFLPLFAFCADYDCIVVGSSPISLFEALYQKSIGKRVLILESSCCLGGAWRSIPICGVEDVDLGCHMIGKNQGLADFFHLYAGCQIVPIDTPDSPFAEIGKHGFYFAGGCHELIEHLQNRLIQSGIEVLLNHQVSSAVVNEERNEVLVGSENRQFTASKVILTPYTRICERSEEAKKVKFYHLYLLIQDPTPPRFSYSWGIPNTVRMNNVTHLVNLQNTGRQLIILQTNNHETLQKGELIVELLKQKNLLDSQAYLICSENHIYYQWPSSKSPEQTRFPDYFEFLDTNHLVKMEKYIEKWKKSLQPYQP